MKLKRISRGACRARARTWTSSARSNMRNFNAKMRIDDNEVESKGDRNAGESGYWAAVGSSGR